jgi:MFS family permease
MPYKRYPLIFAWIIWGLAAMFYCYEYLLRILPSVMSDYLRNLFMINGFAFGNLAAAYYYTYVPMQLPAGILMDRANPRKILAAACLVCAVGTYGFTSPHLYIAYMGRCLVGLGSAFAFVGVMKLSTLWFPPHYFSFITGLTTSLGMLGAMVGNITLVRLMHWLGPHKLLLGAVIIGFLLALIIHWIIPQHSTGQATQPVRPLNTGRYRTEIFALLQDPQMWLLGTIGCCLFLSLTTFAEMWGIPYLVEHYKLSQQYASYYNALVFLGWAMGSPLMGYLASRCHANHLPRLIAVNALLGAICFSLILYNSSFMKPYLGALLFLFGLFSSVQVVVFTIARNFYPLGLSGIAFAVTNLLVMLGGGLSQPMVGYLLDRSSELSRADGLLHFSSQAFVYGLSFLPVSFCLAALLSYCIKVNRK